MFDEILKKLNTIGENKYHIRQQMECPTSFLKLSKSYTDFIYLVGWGRFFGGALVLFKPIDSDNGFHKLQYKPKEDIVNKYTIIGYDGTTSGFYCLRNDQSDCVYWYDSETEEIMLISNHFFTWINEQFNKLYDEKIFAGYKKIKNIDSILKIINEREKVEIRLLEFENELVRPPGKENDFLPRYNKIKIKIFLKEKISINYYTLIIFRTGSKIGADNKVYHTVEVPVIDNAWITLDCYVFDAFNLPFNSITLISAPEINLNSSVRARYKEIMEYL